MKAYGADDIERNAVDPIVKTAEQAKQLAGPEGIFSLGELKLTAIIFVFGIAAMVVFYLLLKHERSTAFTMRLYVVMLIVFGTLLVVASGYSTTQLTPVVGLFGTIAGYLMGKSERNNDPH